MLNILDNTVQNLVALADGRPRSVHPYTPSHPLIFQSNDKRREEGHPDRSVARLGLENPGSIPGYGCDSSFAIASNKAW